MRALLILSLIVFAYGCSADWHLRKAISKKPSILTEGKVIVEVRDTIAVTTEKLLHDTIVEFTTDTIVVEKGKGKATVAIDTVMKTVYVEIECDADTVYLETITEQTVLQPTVKDKGFDWGMLGFIGVVLLFMFLILRFG
jgi:hypothetical protein